MKLVLVVGAVLCGVALLIKLSTGDLQPTQVAGVGIVLSALAVVAP